MPRQPRPAASRHRTQPDPLALAVGQRVRRLRDERDFTFDAFVEETGLGRGYISELERGLVVPSLHALAKLSSALEVTIADLVLADSPRERLFEATRDLDAGDIESLLATAQEIRGEEPPPRPMERRAAGARAHNPTPTTPKKRPA